jgi:hypothetical protein
LYICDVTSFHQNLEIIATKVSKEDFYLVPYLGSEQTQITFLSSCLLAEWDTAVSKGNKNDGVPFPVLAGMVLLLINNLIII